MSFGFTLPGATVPHYIASGATPPAECPSTVAGTPQKGHLCVYEASVINSTKRGTFNAATGDEGATTAHGFVVFANAAAAGVYRVRGEWVVTAP